jgi:hypothetical protein
MLEGFLHVPRGEPTALHIGGSGQGAVAILTMVGKEGHHRWRGGGRKGGWRWGVYDVVVVVKVLIFVNGLLGVWYVKTYVHAKIERLVGIYCCCCWLFVCVGFM